MVEIEHYKKLRERVGEEIAVSGWHLITQEQVNQFADLTGDDQWIHVNIEKAKKQSPYESPVAHGFFILSLVSKFFFESMVIKGVSLSLNYGLNKVRFTHPVVIGSQIRSRMSVLDYLEIEHGARVFYKVIIEIEGIEKPACVAETISQIYAEEA